MDLDDGPEVRSVVPRCCKRNLGPLCETSVLAVCMSVDPIHVVNGMSEELVVMVDVVFDVVGEGKV